MSENDFQQWDWYAEYEDAEDLYGTVAAEGTTNALDFAAHDLSLQTGHDPISYGKLVRVTVESEDGITMTVRPEYDD